MLRRSFNLIKRFRPTCIALVALRSYLDRKKYSGGDISALGGATTVHRPLADSVSYIQNSFADFNRYANLSPAHVSGKTMVELGPGDNLGIGLLYMAWGAASYTGMDRFYSTHDLAREKEIYLALRSTLNEEERHRFDDAVDLSAGVKFNEAKIRYHYGTAAEDCNQPLAAASVDIVLGRGVLQATDIHRALPAIQRLLKPGGLTCHKVELRDLGMFSHNGFHPLEFLTLNDSTYRWMVEGADRPNRRHIHDYRKLLSDLGFDATIRIACVIDPSLAGYPDAYREVLPHKERLVLGVDYNQSSLDLVRAIRPRLDPHFRELSDEELMAAGIFFTATKRA
jgi:SAM-dependent methyltransferase